MVDYIVHQSTSAGFSPGTITLAGGCAPSSILVIGLGNPILGDDGVGWQVVKYVEEEMVASGAEFDYLATGGLGLMERLVGYDKAILVDAILAGNEIGQTSVLKLTDLPNRPPGYVSSAHDTTLHTALELGRMLGAKLPEELVIVAVAIEQQWTFKDTLSPLIEKAVPVAANVVREHLLSFMAEEE